MQYFTIQSGYKQKKELNLIFLRQQKNRIGNINTKIQAPNTAYLTDCENVKLAIHIALESESYIESKALLPSKFIESSVIVKIVGINQNVTAMNKTILHNMKK